MTAHDSTTRDVHRALHQRSTWWRSSGMLLACALVSGCHLPLKNRPGLGPQSTVGTERSPSSPVVPASFTESAQSDPLASARTLERQGRLEEAISAYELLTNTPLSAPIALHRLAVLHERLGRHEQATRYFHLAMERDDRNPDLACDYGYSCYLRDQLAEAESHFRRALQLDARHLRAQNNLGLVLARQGHGAEALQAFLAAGCTPEQARANSALATADREQTDGQVMPVHLQRAPGSN